ncbi:MAG: DNA mismatch repair protein MutS, partial [Chthonomonas sp.]|nr:DNA mismatch repair protein MutS [Chthonomonas sp.]
HESGDQVIWTHKVLAGGTDRSYGIHVARAAGMPPEVLRRAAQILQDLENQPDQVRAVKPNTQRVQLTLFEAEEHEFLRDLRSMDVYALTPMQALQLLEQWQTSLR